MVQTALKEIQDKLSSWGSSPPKVEVLEHSQQILNFKGQDHGNKILAVEKERAAKETPLRPRQEEAPKNGKGKGGSKKSKGKGHGIDELPRFDVRRAFPNKTLCTWQSANRALENAEAPPNSLVQCKDAAQILFFPDMAKVAGIKDEIILFTTSSDHGPVIPGAKRVLLSFLGCREGGSCGYALWGSTWGAWDFAQEDGCQDTSLAALRINAALDFIRQPLKNEMLRNPALALKAAGIQNIVTEVRTFKWTTSQNRMVSGYISFDSAHVQAILGCSGTGGIFFQRLAIHASPAEVEWIPHGEKESYDDYLQRALETAKKNGTHLTYRKGGGAFLLPH